MHSRFFCLLVAVIGLLAFTPGSALAHASTGAVLGACKRTAGCQVHSCGRSCYAGCSPHACFVCQYGKCMGVSVRQGSTGKPRSAVFRALYNDVKNPAGNAPSKGHRLPADVGSPMHPPGVKNTKTAGSSNAPLPNRNEEHHSGGGHR